jgi:hypothetical protein
VQRIVAEQPSRNFGVVNQLGAEFLSSVQSMLA